MENNLAQTPIAPPTHELATYSMTLNDPRDYWLELINGASYRLFDHSGQCRFSSPETLRGIPKLYTLSCAGVLLYVGIAKQPMSARLSLGLRASGRDGYHGYKWKHLKHRLQLTVWSAHRRGTTTHRDLEIIEAEVAFECRTRSGQWPTHQNEIHFHPSSSKHRQLAAKIFSHALFRKG